LTYRKLRHSLAFDAKTLPSTLMLVVETASPKRLVALQV